MLGSPAAVCTTANTEVLSVSMFALDRIDPPCAASLVHPFAALLCRIGAMSDGPSTPALTASGGSDADSSPELTTAFTKIGALLSCHACGTAAYCTEPIPLLAFLTVGLSSARASDVGCLDAGPAAEEAAARVFLRTAPLNVSELPSRVDGAVLAQLLAELPRHAFLRSLSVTGVSVAVAQVLVGAGGGFPGVRSLKCNGPGVVHLAARLRGLRNFDAAWQQGEWTTDLVGSVCDVLTRSASLRKVDFAGDKLGAEGLGHVAMLIERSPSLRWIDLYGNVAGDDGARLLAAALRTGPTLRHLELRTNAIGSAGAIALGAALPHATSLAWLNLENNRIGDEGIAAVALGAAASSSLRDVQLSGCRGGAAAALALAECVARSPVLRRLEAAGTHFDAAAALALANAMHRSRTLAHLKLDDTGMQAHAATLAAGVAQCGSLRWLSLASNHIDDDAALTLAATFSRCALKHVDLGDNNFGPTGRAALLAVAGCTFNFR
jgi:Ran GTPase-activating protein (RanGAP) involved in mRNA processing and transport